MLSCHLQQILQRLRKYWNGETEYRNFWNSSCTSGGCSQNNYQFTFISSIINLTLFSPTGCTFWGKKPWTRKKKLLWQLGTLVGAPLGIALIAGISVPGIIFGVPIFVGKKVYQRFLHHPKSKRRLITVLCVVGSLIVSPVLALLAIGVGIPIALSYVYGMLFFIYSFGIFSGKWV